MRTAVCSGAKVGIQVLSPSGLQFCLEEEMRELHP